MPARQVATLQSDRRWLAAAARLGSRGRPQSRPNPAVGAIIVKDGKVVGRGWTQPGGRPHGEAMALAQAGENARGAAAYVSLEPCAHRSQRGPACSDILVQSGVERVVYAIRDPDHRTAGAGAQTLIDSGIRADHIQCEEADRSLTGYLCKAARGRPHVTLKLAMSLDGFIARPDGESQWITGEIARSHVHSRRAMADAILVGGGTWRKDRPRLDVRLNGLEDRSPQRVVLTRGVPIDGVKIINEPAQIALLDGVQYVYLEGGGQAAASFMREGLVDRIEIYRAPILLGAGLPALGDYGLSALADAHGQWKMTERRMLGSDTYEAYERAYETPHAGE